MYFTTIWAGEGTAKQTRPSPQLGRNLTCLVYGWGGVLALCAREHPACGLLCLWSFQKTWRFMNGSTEGDHWGPEGAKVREAALASYCQPARVGKVSLSPGWDAHIAWDV